MKSRQRDIACRWRRCNLALTETQLEAVRTARQGGVSLRDIATGLTNLGIPCSKSSLQRQLKLAPVENIEECEIVIPINGLFPGSRPTLIPDGDKAYDAVSHRTGFEDHPRLQRDPRTDPKPEPKKKHDQDKPGGIGDLKTKPTWELPGLEHRVTAWTKAEAKALFREYLRSQGEKGRYSVPISNPKRVKTA